MRKVYYGLKAISLENKFCRIVLLPESNAKIIEMTYKPTGRNVIKPARALGRFRFEEWVRQGYGPKSDNILAFEVMEKSATQTVVALTTKDGAQIERTIRLSDDAIYFKTVLKAKEARAFNFLVHPEYDAGSGSDNPQEISIYVEGDEWLQANKDWINAKPNDEQSAMIKEGLKGGAFAYFNQKANFGIEQRFEPGTYENLNLFWSPERIQINLEMTPTIKKLQAGEQAEFAYEVHYLDKAPVNR
jgi:hypothetical protein